MNGQDRLMTLFALLFYRSWEKSALRSMLNVDSKTLGNLIDSLDQHLRCYTPLQVLKDGDTVSLATAPEYSEILNRVLTETQKSGLTKAQMEVLAVIAYKQPVTKAEIDRLRGVDSEKPLHALRQLGFVEVKGPLSKQGSPLVYVTTRKFLQFFNLRSLRDLPPLDHISF